MAELYPDTTIKELRSDLQSCIEYADEKVAVAVQTYELVRIIHIYKQLSQYCATNFPLAFIFLKFNSTFLMVTLMGPFNRLINTFED